MARPKMKPQSASYRTAAKPKIKTCIAANRLRLITCLSHTKWVRCRLQSEKGIYRDNLSAIVIGDNFLSIIVIAQNSLDLSITVIAFAIYFVIADKLSR